VARVIQQSLDEGWSVPQTATAIREELLEAKKWQATMLARTDLIGLANGGSWVAAMSLGDARPRYKRWINADDEKVRPTHVEAMNQVVGIDQPFQVGDSSLRFPGDPLGEDDEVINCRCTLVYGDEPDAWTDPLWEKSPIFAAGWDESEHPRDPGGEGGGEFVSKGTVPLEGKGWASAPGRAAEVQALVDELQARYDTEFRRVLARDTEEFEQLAGKSNDTIYVSPRFLDEAFMDEHLRSWSTVSKAVEPKDIVTHEFGHILDGELLRKHPAEYEELNAFLEEKVELGDTGRMIPRIQSGLEAPSAYGSENRYEFVAEAFLDWYRNGEKAHPSSQFVGKLFDESLKRRLVAAGWDESEHPRDPGGEGGGQFVEDGRNEYEGVHDAPDRSSGAPLHDLANEEMGVFPDDIYGPDAGRYYQHMPEFDEESLSVIREARGKPDLPVKIYRAVPPEATSINPGDWVTPSRSYAAEHAAGEDGWKILELTVPARELFTDANSIHEFGWDPDKPVTASGRFDRPAGRPTG
jgi:hypothetical protein